MSTSKDTTAEVPSAASKKKAVWPLNILAALLLLFTLTLSSPDPVTRVVTTACLSIALGASYFSVRRRVNVVGLLLLLAAVYFYAAFLLVLLKKA